LITFGKIWGRNGKINPKVVFKQSHEIMLGKIAFWLVILGGINQGLAALNMNLVDQLLTAGSTASQVVYLLVGLSAVYMLLNKRK